MGERIYELDRQGDITFVVYDVPDSLPQTLDQLQPFLLDGSTPVITSPAAAAAEEEQTTENEQPQAVLKIRASSKHLSLACPQFTRTLHSGFQESHSLHEKGHLTLEIDNWDPAAFLVLMLILHGRTRPVPRRLSLSKLVDFAILVDYYECYEVFQHQQMFAQAGGYLLRTLTGRFCSELPVPRRVCGIVFEFFLSAGSWAGS